jgi:hypothetical protein
MHYTITTELWVSKRDSFLFRCIVPQKGDTWTFVVSRAVLKELSATEVADPPAAFYQFQPQIYRAAQQRMAWADPKEQHELSTDEIRAVTKSSMTGTG